MRCRSLIAALHFSLLTAAASAQAPSTIAEKSVIAAEGSWLKALYGGDVHSLEALEASNFLLITPAGMTTREGHLSILQKRLSKGRPEPTTYTVDERTVLIYDNVAVIADALSVTTKAKTPITSSGRYWQTEVWHNDNGQLKLVQLHLTPFARERM